MTMKANVQPHQIAFGAPATTIINPHSRHIEPFQIDKAEAKRLIARSVPSSQHPFVIESNLRQSCTLLLKQTTANRKSERDIPRCAEREHPPIFYRWYLYGANENLPSPFPIPRFPDNFVWHALVQSNGYTFVTYKPKAKRLKDLQGGWTEDGKTLFPGAAEDMAEFVEPISRSEDYVPYDEREQLKWQSRRNVVVSNLRDLNKEALVHRKSQVEKEAEGRPIQVQPQPQSITSPLKLAKENLQEQGHTTTAPTAAGKVAVGKGGGPSAVPVPVPTPTQPQQFTSIQQVQQQRQQQQQQRQQQQQSIEQQQRQKFVIQQQQQQQFVIQQQQQRQQQLINQQRQRQQQQQQQQSINQHLGQQFVTRQHLQQRQQQLINQRQQEQEQLYLPGILLPPQTVPLGLDHTGPPIGMDSVSPYPSAHTFDHHVAGTRLGNTNINTAAPQQMPMQRTRARQTQQPQPVPMQRSLAQHPEQPRIHFRPHQTQQQAAAQLQRQQQQERRQEQFRQQEQERQRLEQQWQERRNVTQAKVQRTRAQATVAEANRRAHRAAQFGTQPVPQQVSVQASAPDFDRLNAQVREMQQSLQGFQQSFQTNSAPGKPAGRR